MWVFKAFLKTGVDWIFLILVSSSFHSSAPLTLKDLSTNVFLLAKGTFRVEQHNKVYCVLTT